MYVQGVPKIVVQHFEVESRSKKRSNAFSFKASFSRKKGRVGEVSRYETRVSARVSFVLSNMANATTCFLLLLLSIILPRYRSACNVTFFYSDLIEWFSLVNVTNIRLCCWIHNCILRTKLPRASCSELRVFFKSSKVETIFVLILRRCYHS